MQSETESNKRFRRVSRGMASNIMFHMRQEERYFLFIRNREKNMKTTEPMLENDDQNKKIILWASDYLLSHGYTLKSNIPENVQNTPWSYIVRFVTSKGYIYLKHTPHLLALEANILRMLDDYSCPVAKVIAHNAKLDCFLMKDAGRPLREILKKQFDAELFCKAIDQFTSMQLLVADHVNNLIDIGVPDWRLNKLPELFAQLLTQKDLLIEDGLLQNEIAELKKFIPAVTNLCNELSAHSIKQSIVQPDFNDNNTLIDASQNITIIDLGEIVISHPFFSLLNGLQQMEKHHALTSDSNDYLKIRDACLNNYLAFESRENLLHALKLARPLWFIYGALAGHRLIEACGKAKIMSYQHGKFISSLREFIAVY